MSFIEKYNKALWYVIALSLIVYGYTSTLTENLPDHTEIEPPLYAQPKQTETSRDSFIKEYDGKEYMIEPKFEYDIHGLIVSYQNLDEKWFNIYYENDPYNIKDLCIIWGSNLLQNDYKTLKYWSGTWTCYYQWYSQTKPQFNHAELSNNHILPDTEEISAALKKARTGDQVHFKGYLVDYSVIADGQSSGVRTTSTHREDKGNGACEVVYVEEFKILKHANLGWRILNSFAFGLALLGVFIKLYIFFYY